MAQIYVVTDHKFTPEEARILAAFRELKAERGAQKALDALGTVLLNMAIVHCGGASAAQQFRQFADVAEGFE